MTASSKAQAGAPAANALRQAMTQRTLVVITARTDSGWMTLKSRFLPESTGPGVLCIEQPRAYRNHRPRFARGQNIGLSFRSGHTKYVFETEVVDPGEDDAGQPLSLRWPDRVEHLQRRMYVRTKIPAQLTLPVDVHAVGAGRGRGRPGAHLRGMMLDMSPGGVGISVPDARDVHWPVGQTVRCAFQTGPHEGLWELTGRVRYCQARSDDSLRVGLQFADPETLQQGRAALQEIGRLAGRLRRAGQGRSGQRLC